MTVKQRGTSWQAYIQHEGQRIRKSFSSLDEAEAWEKAARLALKVGKPVPTAESASLSLKDMFRKTYLMHWKGGKSEAKMIQNIRQLEAYFGANTSISALTTDVVDEYIMSMKENNKANGTINRHLATLSKMLRYAVDTGHLDKLPKIHRQKEGEGRLRWLTTDEERAVLALLEQWGADDIRDAAIVSLDTGCRLGELSKIKATDVIKEGVYFSDRKAANHTVIPLTARAREVLERRKIAQGDQLFPYSGYWIRQTWERVKNHLGLEDVVWHTLRHTTCSRLVQRGMPLMHVKEWMGHKSIQTTMRYSHLSTTHLTNGVNLLEQ